jgi:protocatechuate 3,4-dioxygenase beta subunit
MNRREALQQISQATLVAAAAVHCDSSQSDGLQNDVSVSQESEGASDLYDAESAIGADGSGNDGSQGSDDLNPSEDATSVDSNGSGEFTEQFPEESAQCVLTPSSTAGPFYFDSELDRYNITDSKPGTMLEVWIKVLDATSCLPIVGAPVEIWHADAVGSYSGYPNQGQTGNNDTTQQKFLRGYQSTDSQGFSKMESIYPGWYPGRSTHVHFKVFLDNQTLVTSQFYFPDFTTESIYLDSPYVEQGIGMTPNSQDQIFSNTPDAQSLVVNMQQIAGGWRAMLTVGVAT